MDLLGLNTSFPYILIVYLILQHMNKREHLKLNAPDRTKITSRKPQKLVISERNNFELSTMDQIKEHWNNYTQQIIQQTSSSVDTTLKLNVVFH
jgi:hypothetical protein